MSIKVTLIDGTTIEKDDYEYEMVVPRLLKVGCKLWKLNEDMLVVADKIAFVEDTTDYEEREAKEVADILAEVQEVEAAVTDDIPEEEEAPKEKVLTAQQRAEKKLAMMKELSECPHEEHIIYYQESTAGKNRKPIKRYFPVCKKCGVREKFLKSSLLPDEVKDAAKLWDK